MKCNKTDIFRSFFKNQYILLSNLLLKTLLFCSLLQVLVLVLYIFIYRLNYQQESSVFLCFFILTFFFMSGNPDFYSLCFNFLISIGKFWFMWGKVEKFESILKIELFTIHVNDLFSFPFYVVNNHIISIHSNICSFYLYGKSFAS